LFRFIFGSHINHTQIIILQVTFIIYQLNIMASKFPNNFMFGTSTAAYQIEGGWNEDGRCTMIFSHLHN